MESLKYGFIRGCIMVLVLSFLLAGCTGSSNLRPGSLTVAQTDPANSADLDEVTLKMYLIGDKSKDFDLVYDQLNKYLYEDIRATVQVSFLGWGEYQQKYPLLFASGEAFDLIFTANWAFYNNQSMKGGFMEITKEMLNAYAPRTEATMYAQAWEQAKVNGKVYMIPMNYKELNDFVYLVRGDLMDKYGIDPIRDIDDFEAYLEAVAQNEKQLIPLDIGSDYDFSSLVRLIVCAPRNMEYVEPHTLNHVYDLTDEDAHIYSIVELPEFLEFAKKMKEWNEKGYWSKSALVNKVSVKDSFIQGKSASAVVNLETANSIYMSVSSNNPEWQVRVYDAMNGKGVTIKPYIQNGMGISANSKHPERALMFLDLVRNEQKYADLVTYGIEGIHYQLTKDGKVKPLAATVNYPIDDNCNWGFRNESLMRDIEGRMPNYQEIRNSWEKVALSHPIQNYSFDDSKVKNEIALLNNLWRIDYKVVVMGFTVDPEEEVRKLREKYKLAGDDTITAIQEKQMKEYLDSLSGD